VTTTSVNVLNSLSFDPKDIQVAPGATVTWTWGPNNPTHNVTFSDPSITDSPDQASGTFSSAMPSAPGTYNYTCTFHGGMDGSVLVQ
jgi:plastocyanin